MKLVLAVALSLLVTILLCAQNPPGEYYPRDVFTDLILEGPLHIGFKFSDNDDLQRISVGGTDYELSVGSAGFSFAACDAWEDELDALDTKENVAREWIKARQNDAIPAVTDAIKSADGSEKRTHDDYAYILKRLEDRHPVPLVLLDGAGNAHVVAAFGAAKNRLDRFALVYFYDPDVPYSVDKNGLPVAYLVDTPAAEEGLFVRYPGPKLVLDPDCRRVVEIRTPSGKYDRLAPVRKYVPKVPANAERWFPMMP